MTMCDLVLVATEADGQTGAPSWLPEVQKCLMETLRISKPSSESPLVQPLWGHLNQSVQPACVW